jgi:hypothetical protein
VFGGRPTPIIPGLDLGEGGEDAWAPGRAVFLGRMDIISSGRHRGSVATAYYRLVCPFVLKLKIYKKREGWGGFVSFVSSLLVAGGIDSIQPRAQQRLNHANNTGPKAGIVCAVFSSLGHGVLGGGPGGFDGPGGGVV